MSHYTADARGALADVAAAGASVTFTRETRTISQTDGTSTSTTTTIAGSAIEKMSGESDVYETLGLVRALAPLLFFTPSTFGNEVQVGDTCTWNGDDYTVRWARHLRPDGDVIASYVVVGR